MNPNLARLQAYPFEKLKALKVSVEPTDKLDPIALSVGEPRHEPPQFVIKRLIDSAVSIAKYPLTAGSAELRNAIAVWASRRFALPSGALSAEKHVLPVNGTREALFAIAQTVVDNTVPGAKVLMPNPFYQIYEGACLMAGADPHFINCSAHSDYNPDFASIDKATWDACQLLYICTPGNPTGATLSIEQLKMLIALADRHDFIIVSDECYSEIYFDHAPPGLLQACAESKRFDFARCVVFNSLSKRSNLPGLRSGFVAGDATIIRDFLRYRTYHGSAMSGFSQAASAVAWQDERHVTENRTLYHKKFTAALDILSDFPEFYQPSAGFFLWPEMSMDDTEFARQLFAQKNITVLPGSFLARQTALGNPAKNHVRMAMVGTLDECIEAARRIKDFMSTNITPC